MKQFLFSREAEVLCVRHPLPFTKFLLLVPLPFLSFGGWVICVCIFRKAGIKELCLFAAKSLRVYQECQCQWLTFLHVSLVFTTFCLLSICSISTVFDCRIHFCHWQPQIRRHGILKSSDCCHFITFFQIQIEHRSVVRITQLKKNPSGTT